MEAVALARVQFAANIALHILFPAILGYTVFAYRAFWGNTRELSYD